MKKIVARIGNKIIGEWPIPGVVNEISYRQRIMFLYAYEKFMQRGQLDPIEELKAYCAVIASFFDIEIKEVMNMPMNMYDGFQKEMTGLFLYLFRLMNSYKERIRTKKGEDHHFIYKGEEWLIPWAINADDVDVTFGQGIELLEIQRKAIADAENRTDLDSIEYSADLRMIAILAKKPGEQLPTGEVAINRLMEQRAIYFKEIDMVTAMDIVFFSKNGFAKLMKKKASNGFGTLLHQLRQIKQKLKRTISDAMRDN